VEWKCHSRVDLQWRKQVYKFNNSSMKKKLMPVEKTAIQELKIIIEK
jgi:hypothetical protein